MNRCIFTLRIFFDGVKLMNKFQIDFEKLGNDFSKVPLVGNEHRLVRVAFDLFRFKDGNPEELWQVQSSDDGEFLVRTYTLPEEQEKVATSWSVELDKKEENLTVDLSKLNIFTFHSYALNSQTNGQIIITPSSPLRVNQTGSILFADAQGKPGSSFNSFFLPISRSIQPHTLCINGCGSSISIRVKAQISVKSPFIPKPALLTR